MESDSVLNVMSSEDFSSLRPAISVMRLSVLLVSLLLVASMPLFAV